MTDLDVGAVAPPTADAPVARPRPRGRVRQHLAEPFARNAYSLVLNTGVTGLLGLAYWLLAARAYGESDVGRGSVTISLMTLLSGVVALSLTGTLTRFIGPSGRRAGSFVATAYLLTAVAVTALTTVFLLALPLTLVGCLGGGGESGGGDLAPEDFVRPGQTPTTGCQRIVDCTFDVARRPVGLSEAMQCRCQPRHRDA